MAEFDHLFFFVIFKAQNTIQSVNYVTLTESYVILFI